MGHPPYLDPIDACVSIFRRAHYLSVPPEEPLGVYTLSLGSYSFLADTIVKRVMQRACRLAYPNPAHEMRIKIDRIVAHSNRVTAAVCLHQGALTSMRLLSVSDSNPAAFGHTSASASKGLATSYKKQLLVYSNQPNFT